MVLAGTPAVLRRSTRWVREVRDAGLEEDWTLVLLGVVVLLATIGLAVAAAWTVHQRDAALRDATAAGQRLDGGGLDYTLYRDLITMQQDEVALFQARVDSAAQGPDLRDPYGDLATVDSDLARLKAQIGISVRIERDISLISGEMTPFFSVEASAQDDNRQGLPVGAAYLREASQYLTGETLHSAADIRQVDEAQVSTDDSEASAVPWPLLAIGLITLVCLMGVQILTARYTRCQFDPWLLLSTAVTVLVLIWSVTALSVSLHEVGSDTSPYAREASALAQVLVVGLEDHNDDLLTQADHGEDCSTSTSAEAPYRYQVTCAFETQVVNSMKLKGQLTTDLDVASTDAPDQLARGYITTALAAKRGCLEGEEVLPTLQNLAIKAENPGSGKYEPRYSSTFEEFLAPYTSPETDSDQVVNESFQPFQQAVQAAIDQEWASYNGQASSARATLSGAVMGAVLLGLLAAAAGSLGMALRVAEYWSAGRRTA